MNPDLLYKVQSAFKDFKNISLIIDDIEYIKYTNSNVENFLTQTDLLLKDENIEYIEGDVYIPINYLYLNEQITHFTTLILNIELPEYSNILIPYFYSYKENKILEITQNHTKKKDNRILLDILPLFIDYLKSNSSYQESSYTIKILVSRQKPSSFTNSVSSYTNCNKNFKYYTYFDIVCKIKKRSFTLQLLSPLFGSLELNEDTPKTDDNIINNSLKCNKKISTSLILFGFISILILVVYCIHCYNR